MSEELRKAIVHLYPDQDETTGVTTYSVVLDHMNHGVLLHAGEDRDRAEEIQFVVQHEIDRAWNRRAGEGELDEALREAISKTEAASIFRDERKIQIELREAAEAERDALAARVEKLEAALTRIATIEPKTEHGPHYVAGQLDAVKLAAAQAIEKNT